MALLGAQFVNAVSPNPVGSLQAYAGASAPSGWLLCDGTSYSTTLWPELFNVLEYTYGGSGSSFNVPDLRGRVPMGAGTGAQNGGTGTGAISGGTSLTARTRGAFGGDERLQDHTHNTPGSRLSTLYTAGGSPLNGWNAPTVSGDPTGNPTNGGGSGGNMPPFLVTNYIIKAVPDAPRSGLAYGSTPPIVTALPANPQFGDVVTYKHTATGNIGALAPMQYDGVSWKPLASTILCRWSCGNASQTITTTSVVNITTGDYGSVSFTPPWDGWYEFAINMRNVQLTTGIGISVYLSNANFSANHEVAYFEDVNGYVYHTKIPITGPRVDYLYASNTYRWASNITYAVGNSGTLFTSGTAYIAAVSR